MTPGIRSFGSIAALVLIHILSQPLPVRADDPNGPLNDGSDVETFAYVDVRDLTPERLQTLRHVKILDIWGNLRESDATLRDAHESEPSAFPVESPVALPDLSSLKYLTHLMLLNTLDCIEDVTPLAGLSHLEVLAIIEQENDATIDVSPLSHMASLKHLTINGVEVDSIAPLAHLQDLEYVELVSCGIHDVLAVGSMVGLRHLNLEDNEIRDVSAISTLPGLSYLDLSGNEVEDISALTRLEGLDVLDLRRNPLNPYAYSTYLPQIISKNPNVGIECDVETHNTLRNLALPALCLLYPGMLIGISVCLVRMRRKKLIPIVVVIFLLALAPLPVRHKDRENVVEYSIKALLSGRRVVVLNRGYIPLYDSDWYNEYKKLYYENDIDVDTAIYERLGLKACAPEDAKVGFDFRGKAFIQFTGQDVTDGTGSPGLHFNYYHGSLAAQGYRVIIYRNVLGRFIFYIHEWVS